MFKEALQNVVEGTQGGLAGLLMDFEGIPLETYTTDQAPFDIENRWCRDQRGRQSHSARFRDARRGRYEGGRVQKRTHGDVDSCHQRKLLSSVVALT